MKRKKNSSAALYKALLEKVQNMDLGGGGIWKPKVGRSVIRILPPVGGMDFFFQQVGRHYDQRQYCPLLSTEGELPCPICELNENLYAAGEKDAASKFRASKAFWMNIVDRSSDTAGPQIYAPGVTVFQILVSMISDPDYGDITDVEDGFDIKIDRDGQGIDTKYQVLPVRNPSPLNADDAQVDEWLVDAEDLSERVIEQLKNYDELIVAAGIQAYFDEDGNVILTYEEEEEELEDEEEDEPPARPSPRRRGRRG